MALGRFLVKRILQGLLVIWGVITVVFLLRFVTPGSPIDAVAPLDATQETRQAIAAELGLDQPLHLQYLTYLGTSANRLSSTTSPSTRSASRSLPTAPARPSTSPSGTARAR